MNPPVPLEKPYLNQVSQEIAACVVQLIAYEHQERAYVAMLEQKAALERRIAFLSFTPFQRD
jgi:hypothetical protein